ncbi:MAG: o-succinylbenzoate--CoA ligase [Chloroflexota bacterium]|nr:MAG: o-succinylbenzoate--CoA ligase [Chloroflexota bacterium]
MTTIPDWLGQRARTTPERIALSYQGTSVTYGDLEQSVAALAGGFVERAHGVGTRIALLGANSLRYAECVHAVSRAGAILVPLNARLTAAEIAFQIDDCQPTVLLVDPDSAELARDAVSAAQSSTRLEFLDRLEPGSPLLPRPVDLAAPHSILYTSGTTGRPKGAVLTNGNHWWSAVASALNLGIDQHDRWLATLPLFHVGGLSILLRSTIYGTTAVIHRGFDPEAVGRALTTETVTIVSLVTAMLDRLLSSGPFDYSGLRAVLLGGGPAPRALFERAAAQSVPVIQTYGLTEAASQVATLAPEDALRKLGSAGKPLMPTDLRIDGDGRAGSIGEIGVRGPTISPGYWHSARGVTSVTEDGWFHTGDLGYLDDDGYLYVVDRRDDMFVSGGENVYPAEVEAALVGHHAVAEAVVVGVPDREWGAIGAAAIVLRPGADPTSEELARHCRSVLAGYKVPRVFRFVPDVPRTASGKPLRRDVRPWFA